jgi:hypothetical protein
MKVSYNKQCSSHGFPCCVPNFDEMIMDPHVGKLEKNSMGMGVHKIVEQMGKVYPKNWAKIVTPKEWLITKKHYL